ncbi:MAG: hypothetical protein ACJ748_14100, partial [Flavisolibacter sp.]
KGNRISGTYKISGTAFRKEGTITGKWIKINTVNNNSVYQLNDKTGIGLIYLMNVDDNIILFTDETGRPLVGNEDFSYTLNRKW